MKLEVEDITKKYGDKTALDNVSLTLSEGMYGLLGPNGAGKSTLMNIITYNIASDAGEVRWEDRKIAGLGRDYRRILGYAPQQQGLYETFTGRRFLSYMGTLKELKKNELKSQIEWAADVVNLTDVLDRRIGTYSGGMKQRLLIAQAIMADPKLIILDEPTAGLDPKERIRVRESLAKLAEDRIILVATHVVSDVENVAKDIIFIKNGVVIRVDTPSVLADSYGSLEKAYMHYYDNAESQEGEISI